MEAQMSLYYYAIVIVMKTCNIIIFINYYNLITSY